MTEAQRSFTEFFNHATKNAQGFFQNKKLRQPFGNEEALLDSIDEADKNLNIFLKETGKALNVHAAIGPTKNIKKARKKAGRDYGGDLLSVKDFVRGKIEVKSLAELQDVMNALNNMEQSLAHEHKIEIAEEKNCFEKPNRITGYRAINYKVTIPLKNEQYHIAEIQVVAKQLEAFYDHTHDLKDRAEALLKAEEKITQKDKDEANWCFNECKRINSEIAKEHGYDQLEKTQETITVPLQIIMNKKQIPSTKQNKRTDADSAEIA